MFIKANNGNYVNIDSICSFGVYSTPYGKKGVAYRVRGYTFNLSHYEFGGEFATKEAANDWMAKMVSHLNAGMPKPTPAKPSRESLLNALHGYTNDFALSGDTDYLLRINAYIREYLKQEGQHD